MVDVIHKCAGEVYCNAICKIYPDSSGTLLVADKAIFRRAGYEEISTRAERGGLPDAGAGCAAANLDRAKRRARNAVIDYARCNPMRYFVTFTLDASKVDRYDIDAVMRTANRWLDNRVRRHGLQYVLVPELHKDGAIHFHGLVNDAVTLRDSGTIALDGDKPRRPRSAREREKWLAAGGHIVYNVDDWAIGFTTAIELYGDYGAAIGYVCKYISKAQVKVGGRWYYSGGGLRKPDKVYLDICFDEACAAASAAFAVPRLAADCVRIDIDGGLTDGANLQHVRGVPRAL